MSEVLKVFLAMIVISIAVWIGVGMYLQPRGRVDGNYNVANTNYLQNYLDKKKARADANNQRSKKEKELTLNQPLAQLSESEIKENDSRLTVNSKFVRAKNYSGDEQDAEASADGSASLTPDANNKDDKDGKKQDKDGESTINAEENDSEDLTGVDKNGETPPSAEDRADSDEDIQRQLREDANQTPDEQTEKNDKPTNESRRKALLASVKKQPRKPEPILAVDVTLEFGNASGCRIPADALTTVGVLFRPESAAIKGASLSQLDKLTSLFKNCEAGSRMLLLQHPEKQDNSNKTLRQRRQDEVKYYLLQHSVPKTAMRYIDTP